MKKTSRYLKRVFSGGNGNFVLAFFALSPLIVYFFYRFLPNVPNDWTKVFYAVSKIPFQPYQNSLFINPPWLALFLSPFSFMSAHLSKAFNAFFTLFFLSLLIKRTHGRAWAYALTFTSFPFLALLANGTVDWVVAAGLIFGSPWGIPFLLAKPQTGAFVALLWFKKVKDKKQFLLVSLVFVGLSFAVWGNWVQLMLDNINSTPLGDWNASLFPWSIPLGFYFAFISLKYEDTLAAIIAGLCFTPYFALHSTIVGFALLSVRYPKISAIIWGGMWCAYFCF